MQIHDFIDCLRIRANFIKAPEGSQKGQDAFLMDNAAEILERTFRILERNSSKHKPGNELLSQIQREINAPTEVPPPHDFTTPEIPGFEKRFEINKRQALVEDDQKRGKANTCVDASGPVASHA